MNKDLLQPAATITAVLIQMQPVKGISPTLQETLVSVYRALEAAQKQIAEEDQAKQNASAVALRA